MLKTVFELDAGDVVRVVYKGEVRNVQVEQPVTHADKGNDFIKVLDLDKKGFRTFTACEVQVIGPVDMQAYVIPE